MNLGFVLDNLLQLATFLCRGFYFDFRYLAKGFLTITIESVSLPFHFLIKFSSLKKPSEFGP